VLKRAQYFITCKGRLEEGLKITERGMRRQLMSENVAKTLDIGEDPEQLSFFDEPAKQKLLPEKEDYVKCLTGQM
jgi:hypothetical protein